MRHVFSSQFGGQHTDGLGCGGGVAQHHECAAWRCDPPSLGHDWLSDCPHCTHANHGVAQQPGWADSNFKRHSAGTQVQGVTLNHTIFAREECQLV